MPVAVTPSGVRDGDPGALAGLCAARGPSVLAYCRNVAGDDDAADAAAEAFAAFRATVVATHDLADLNPEALLINATRRAAARRAPHASIGVCAVAPLLLAARADKTISAADLELFEEHLAGCSACRAPLARFDAAERAYRDPPSPLMDPGVVASIIAAMAAAAPAGDDEPTAAPLRGDDPLPASAQAVPVAETTADGVTAAATSVPPAAADTPDQPTAADVPDRPTTEFQTLDVHEPDPAAPDEPEPKDAVVSEAVEEKPRRDRFAARGAAGAGGARSPRVARSPAAAKAEAAPAGVLAADDAGSSRGGGRSRSRGKLPLAIILPVAVVLIALLLALFVAGVFGGNDPASSPRVVVPSDVPAQTEPADVVVVPGAKQSGPDDVEVAKARERARARRKREAAAAREAAATPQANPQPASSATPPPAAVAPPPPPPPAAANRGDGSRTVEPGRGATGAEQIPPAEDTSTVPDLAPAPEPATAP